ncbi:FUSC family protein [Silvimonas amylolytica]|uniref:Integral membrane bound transporter domain-containing protein n=1 Tax=Silvimonas amylolytica TaxID=449663 RepID=A0ABQ2PJB2_9NEIS|nr:aromatic acid exporter family protein [Silvimonas amylolytica]GGP25693.1 hypothetical protein GCM10010971_15120 [Silvimonas amylolytica]
MTRSIASAPRTFKSRLADFSLTDNARYLKFALAMWLGYFPAYWYGNNEVAIGMATSAMLTLALGNSVNAAQSYFYQRVLTNVIAVPVGCLVLWLTHPHFVLGVVLVPIVILGLVKLRPQFFRLTSLTVAMTLILYSGTYMELIEQRLFSVIVGMFLGFAIHKLILPPDHGHEARKLLVQATDAATACVRASLAGHQEALPQLEKSANAYRGSVQMLTVDLNSLMPWHLERYRPDLAILKTHQQVLDFLVDFGKLMKTFAAEYAGASPEFTAALREVMLQMAALHEQLVTGTVPAVQISALQPLTRMNLAGNVHESLFRGKAVEYALLLEKLSKQQPTA